MMLYALWLFECIYSPTNSMHDVDDDDDDNTRHQQHHLDIMITLFIFLCFHYVAFSSFKCTNIGIMLCYVCS